MRRTVFVDHDLQELENPIEYFLHIQPMEYNRFQEIWRTIQYESEECSIYQDNPIVAKPRLTDEIPQGSLLAGYTLAQRLIQHGMDPNEMTATRRRHYYQFYVILYYKHQGFNREETANKVIEWAIHERNCGRSNSSDDEIIRDVRADVKCVFDDDKRFTAMHCDEIRVSHLDIAYVRNIADETTRKVVWCIILLGRMFHDQGQFFFSLRKIESITGCRKSTVHNRVKRLTEDGLIELRRQGSYYKQQANTYYMGLLEDWLPDVTLPTDATTFQDVFEDTYAQIFPVVIADTESITK